MKRMRTLAFVILAAGMMLAAPARGATTTWTGTGDWFADLGNWSGGAPNAGDTAVITSGSVRLTNSTPALAQ